MPGPTEKPLPRPLLLFLFYHSVIEFQHRSTNAPGHDGGGMVETFRPGDWPRFVGFPAFTRDWDQLGLDDAALRALESEILKGPDRTPVIRGTGVSGRSGLPSRDRDTASGEPIASAMCSSRNSGPSRWWRSSARPRGVI
jgi:hypothetical protein